MAVYEFALDSTGTKRIQIFQGESGGVNVLLNGSIIGSIHDQKELIGGREFTLKDGSVLTIRLVNNEFQVVRENQSLRPMSKQAIAIAEAKATTEAAIAPSIRTSNPLVFTPRKSIGWIIAGIGALLALLAFISMPYVSLGPFSITGLQIVSIGSKFGSQFDGLLYLLFEPLVAVILLIIAGVQLFKSLSLNHDDLARGAIGLIVLASTTLLILLGKYFLIDTQANIYSGVVIAPPLSSFYSSGFWTYLVGTIIAIVGGVVAARST